MTRRPSSAQATQAQIQDMFAQSTAVLAQPSPRTFERFERRGGMTQALIYVVVAALVSAVIAALFAPLHHLGVADQFFSRLIGIPAQFALFTGLVYLIGRHLFRGTGTYPEVAYSFALFYVPLSIVASVVGIVPFLGWLVSLVVSVAMIYFGFLAVQSSMNLRDRVSAGVTLVLSGVASFWIALIFL